MDCCPTCRQALRVSRDLRIDVEAGILIRNGRFTMLEPRELELFEALWSSIGKLRTKEQLMTDLYWLRTDNDEPDAKIVDVLICKIRRKLKLIGVEIQTIRGKGYRLLPVIEGSDHDRNQP